MILKTLFTRKCALGGMKRIISGKQTGFVLSLSMDVLQKLLIDCCAWFLFDQSINSLCKTFIDKPRAAALYLLDMALFIPS